MHKTLDTKQSYNIKKIGWAFGPHWQKAHKALTDYCKHQSGTSFTTRTLSIEGEDTVTRQKIVKLLAVLFKTHWLLTVNKWFKFSVYLHKN